MNLMCIFIGRPRSDAHCNLLKKLLTKCELKAT